jgi:hypothetical protein
MPVQQSEVFEAAESLMAMMLSLATDGEADAKDYKALRNVLLTDLQAKSLAPRFLRTCRDPSAFWHYMKSMHSGEGSWQRRRDLIREGFDPLLEALERFDDSPLEALVAGEVQQLGSASVTEAWNRALERRHRDPAGAITAARTLLESVCKTILDDLPTDPSDLYESDDLPKLYARVAERLNLAPSQHTEDALKKILGGSMTVVNGLANLRNRASDSHGAGRKSYRPAPRHAALAVNFAGATALFLLETSQDQREYWSEVAREVMEEED